MNESELASFEFNSPWPPKDRFSRAVGHFVDDDIQLMTDGLSERCITHKLAEKIQLQFPAFHVDCEYNRMIKRGTIKKKEIDNILRGRRVAVFPDIIVHDRTIASRNYVAVEICLEGATLPKILKDKDKIEQYVLGEMQYSFGLLLHFRNFGGAFLYWCSRSKATGAPQWKVTHSDNAIPYLSSKSPNWDNLYDDAGT